MQYRIIPVTPFEQNCSLIWCERSLEAAIVDPGGDLDRLESAVSEAGVTLSKILLTHTHIDHAGGTAELARRHDLPIEGPQEEDRFWIESLPEQAERFGFPPAEVFEPDRWLNQDESVTVGTEQLQVHYCPGHTPGHVVFFNENDRVAIVGDVLFKGSVGRTDFPQGDHATLIASIRQRLWPLGDDVTFIPGHGPTSTFGEERSSNPFVGDHVA